MIDVAEGITRIIPRVDVILLRRAIQTLTDEEVIKSWQEVKTGVDFFKTALGKAYRKEKRLNK